MKMDVALNTIEQMFMLPFERIDFNWHGGEPLLAPFDFFHSIISKQEQLKKITNKKVFNRLQTNATLVNPEWAKFFVSNDFGIGVSLDGPSIVQNKQRPFPEGKESFDSVMNGIRILENEGAKGGKLLVITPHSLEYVYDIFDFCKTYIPNFDIIPCFHVDKATGEVIEPTINPKEFGHFLIQLFDLWIKEDNPELYVRFFVDTLKSMLGGFSTLCSMTKTCNQFITVDWNGDIYPCDNFSGYSSFKLGNILDESLEQILQGKNFQKIAQKMVSTPDNCKKCKWFITCKGGCAHQTFMPGFEFTGRYFYCAARKMFFKHVNDWLSRQT